jgi:GT2 family glycosyltransferase
VLVPTYQDAYLLRKSLPVLLCHPPDEIEILIINNSPTQDIRSSIGEAVDDPRVRIVEMGFEAGFVRAINRGIRESTGGLVMFCNADLFPSATYLAEMLRFFADHARAGAAIGKLLRYDFATDKPTDIIDTAGLVLTRQRRLMPRGEGETDSGQFDDAVEIFAVDGAALVVRRSALETIKVNGEYLDENFIAHKEDHDVSWRVRLAGWECWYVPSAVAYHGRTTRGLGSSGYLSAMRSFYRNEREKSDFVRVHAMKNQWLMLLKNEDAYNFARDFPFILAREAMVAFHHLLFAPKALVAVPMTLKLLRETLRKRRAAKAKQTMDPSALRRWLGRERDALPEAGAGVMR